MMLMSIDVMKLRVLLCLRSAMLHFKANQQRDKTNHPLSNLYHLNSNLYHLNSNLYHLLSPLYIITLSLPLCNIVSRISPGFSNLLASIIAAIMYGL